MTDSSMNLALPHILDPSTWSSLQANTIFFPPYTSDQVRVGVYPGVVPSAVHHAERAGRETVTVENVGAVFAVARRTRLTSAVQTLTPMEQPVLAVLAGMMERREETTSGRVYEAVTAVEPMGYTMFHERVQRVQRVEGLELVRTRRRKKGQGRTREIVVRDGVGEVVSGAVSAGSSVGAVNRCIGVADDEKRRYETGGG